MIPDFPNLRPIKLSDMEVINDYALKFGGYSDFFFSNVWSWDLESKCKISILNNNLVFLFTDYYEGYDFLSFLGNNKVTETALTLLEYADNSNISSMLGFMPEESSLQISKDQRFVALEQRDNFDYTYSIENLSTYPGLRYKNKRGLTNKFAREFPNYRLAVEDLSDPKIQFELRKIFQTSSSQKSAGYKNYYHDLEAKAFERTLEIHKKLNIVLSCTYVDEKIVGFSLDELFSNNSALSHFFKVDYNYVGIYEFQNMHIAKYLLKEGIETWNWVEDLGIENLRKSKMSYRPLSLLKTYNISLA